MVKSVDVPSGIPYIGAVLLFIQHFLISRIRFLDIKKYILRIRFTMKYFLIDLSRIWFEIKFIFWSYQEMEFPSWYQEIISCDIKNSISWYQRNEFLDRSIKISIIIFLDIKKWILDIWKSNSWYQEILPFLDIKNRILDIKKYLFQIAARIWRHNRMTLKIPHWKPHFAIGQCHCNTSVYNESYNPPPPPPPRLAAWPLVEFGRYAGRGGGSVNITKTHDRTPL